MFERRLFEWIARFCERHGWLPCHHTKDKRLKWKPRVFVTKRRSLVKENECSGASDWRPYVGDRLIKETGQCLIIVPKDHGDPVPIVCPVCDVFFSSSDDEQAWQRFKCCSVCADKWAYPNAEKWDNGWRPDIYTTEVVKCESR